MSSIKILFFGDVFGKIGRLALGKNIEQYKEKYQPDIIIANVENLAHGRGITQSTIEELQNMGVTYFTSGNHIWDKKQAYDILNKKDSPIIRPANYPLSTAGSGEKIIKIGLNNILLINLIGRVFFKEDFECPFKTADKIIKKHQNENLNGIIIDFHAEATSEKIALKHYLSGRVTGLLCTHTHVQTSDEYITDDGTAYITDVGMVGPKESVIGLDKDVIVNNFLTQITQSANVPETGICQINGIYLEIDPKTQKALNISRISDIIEV